MKIIKRVFVWIFISLLLQSAIYLYLDKYYFLDESHVKIIQLNNLDKKEAPKTNVAFPEGSSSIDLSYDSKYTSFVDTEGNLNLVKTNSGDKINIPFANNSRCIAYKWLPDTDIIVLAEISNENGNNIIRFYSYDADKENKSEIGDFANKKNYVSVIGTDVKVKIEVSTLTGVMYVQVTSNTSSKIYRIDRNETLTRIYTYSKNIGSLKVASHDDLIAYEDLTAHEIITSDKERIININGNTNLILLASDGNDNIYVGNCVNGKVSEIYYGKLSDDFSTWNQIKLENPSEAQNITITYSGDIYLQTGQSELFQIKSTKKLSFQGKLIGVYDNCYATTKDNKLFINKID